MLNYGHTLGHAVEQVEQYRWRHGEAVSVGLVYAAELAAAVGRLARRRRPAAPRGPVLAVGLPTTYDGPWPELSATRCAWTRRRAASLLRFVVLDGVGRPGRLEGPDDDLLAATYERIRR